METGDTSRQCVKRSVEYALGLSSDEVPDFVQAKADGSFNKNWMEDLSEWAAGRGIGVICIQRDYVTEWNKFAPFLDILRLTGKPLIGAVVHPLLSSGHAVVVEIGPTYDVTTTRISYDPSSPQVKPDQARQFLRFTPGSLIQFYLSFHSWPKPEPWWRRLPEKLCLVSIYQYFMGQAPYAVLRCAFWLYKHWTEIPPARRNIIYDEINNVMAKSLTKGGT